eukprot:3292649-Pyramimonas_sp.AAC.1
MAAAAATRPTEHFYSKTLIRIYSGVLGARLPLLAQEDPVGIDTPKRRLALSTGRSEPERTALANSQS